MSVADRVEIPDSERYGVIVRAEEMETGSKYRLSKITAELLPASWRGHLFRIVLAERGDVVLVIPKDKPLLEALQDLTRVYKAREDNDATT